MLTILFIVKFVSMATAGALGLSGLVHSFKDEKGKLTKRGRWAFAGILISSLLSVLILGLEQYQAISSASETAKSLAESAKRQEEISNKLEKTLHSQEENLTTTKNVAKGMEQSLSDQKVLLQGSTNTLNTTEAILVRQNQSVTQQTRLSSKQEVMLANLTGADGYCYVMPAYIDQNTISLILHLEGRYPIRNAFVSIVESDHSPPSNLQGKPLWDLLMSREQKYELPVVMTKIGQRLTDVDVTSAVRKEYLINIFTPYRKFFERLQLVRVKGRWQMAYRVVEQNPIVINGVETPEKLLKSYIDPNFPRVGQD